MTSLRRKQWSGF